MQGDVRCKKCGLVVRRKRRQQVFCGERCRATYEQAMRPGRRARGRISEASAVSGSEAHCFREGRLRIERPNAPVLPQRR